MEAGKGTDGGEDEMKRLDLFLGFPIISFFPDKSIYNSVIQTQPTRTHDICTHILEKITEPNETNCETIYL